MFDSSLRLLRTLKHLRPVQIYSRLWTKMNRPRPDLSPAPQQRRPTGQWAAPVAKAQSLVGPCRFLLLNEFGEFADSSGWNDAEHSKLWLYNLHYFDDLTAAAADQRTAWHTALLERWVADNPPGIGVGWEPYPTSLRMVNWVKRQLRGGMLSAAQTHSLAIQARWLRRQLEHHLLGNHLLANVKALLFAGICFEGAEADEWRSVALSLLVRELREQVLDDGGHFERSPMYHAIVLEDLLDLVNLTRAFPGVVDRVAVGVWIEKIQRMRSWLGVMTHPDGGIAFFNDAAFGVAAERSSLESYSERLELPPVSGPTENVTVLADSGYIRVQCEAGSVALLDVARVGPDYIPGHAHADTLSFELSIQSRRVIVNSGTSVYARGAERDRQRGTAAHNTVEIDGQDSSEVWAAFRVARRARPVDLRVDAAADRVSISCAHDGYRWLAGRPVHRREWLIKPRSLVVTDRVSGKYRTARARFHLHPEVVVSERGSTGDLLLADGLRVAWHAAGAEARVEQSTWHPQFGLCVPNRCIEVAFTGGESVLELVW